MASVRALKSGQGLIAQHGRAPVTTPARPAQVRSKSTAAAVWQTPPSRSMEPACVMRTTAERAAPLTTAAATLSAMAVTDQQQVSVGPASTAQKHLQAPVHARHRGMERSASCIAVPVRSPVRRAMVHQQRNVQPVLTMPTGTYMESAYVKRTGIHRLTLVAMSIVDHAIQSVELI
jgi:hypothetical protein